MAGPPVPSGPRSEGEATPGAERPVTRAGEKPAPGARATSGTVEVLAGAFSVCSTPFTVGDTPAAIG